MILGDIGAICNDASFALMHAHTGVLRELRCARRAADRDRDRTRTPPGCARSIISRWPKAASAARSGQLAAARRKGMGVHQRERGVVADRADVAEVDWRTRSISAISALSQAAAAAHHSSRPLRSRRAKAIW